MDTKKLEAGSQFPKMKIKNLGGGEIEFGHPKNDADWQMIIVYRGKHCNVCTDYLAQLKSMKDDFLDAGVDVVIVSADTQEKAQTQVIEKLDMPFEVGYDLNIDQMLELGLYISIPRSAKETDRPFSEPGLFIVNEKGQLYVVDISNNPYFRPDLVKVLEGIQWLRNPATQYPIRGTYGAE